MKQVSIFFVLLRTSDSYHDFEQYNHKEKTKFEFYEWVEEKRLLIEGETKKPAVVINMKWI